MIRPSRALGLAALLVAGLSVSVGANAAGTTGSDTTEPTATTEAVETTEPTETSEVVDTTDVVDTHRARRDHRSRRRPRRRRPPCRRSSPSRSSGRRSATAWRRDASRSRSTTPTPTGRTFSLYLVRHLANDPDQRIGSLLVNPGGPGFGGTIFAESAEFIYEPDLLDQLRHRRLGPPWHRRERTGHRLHRQLRRVLRRHRHHPRR